MSTSWKHHVERGAFGIVTGLVKITKGVLLIPVNLLAQIGSLNILTIIIVIAVVLRAFILNVGLRWAEKNPVLYADIIDGTVDVLEVIRDAFIVLYDGVVEIADVVPGVHIDEETVPPYKAEHISAAEVKQYATVLRAQCPSYNSAFKILQVWIQYTIGSDACAVIRYIWSFPNLRTVVGFFIGWMYCGNADPTIGMGTNTNCQCRVEYDKDGVQDEEVIMIICSALGAQYILIQIVLVVIFVCTIAPSVFSGIQYMVISTMEMMVGISEAINDGIRYGIKPDDPNHDD